VILTISTPALSRTGRATQWRIPAGAPAGLACRDWLHSVRPETPVHLDNVQGSGVSFWSTAGEVLKNLAPCPSPDFRPEN
jgi:hypothetical protein